MEVVAGVVDATGGADDAGAGVVEEFVIMGCCRHQKLCHSYAGALTTCATVACTFSMVTIIRPSLVMVGSADVFRGAAVLVLMEDCCVLHSMHGRQ